MNKDAMLKELMELDFKLYELRLYLNTHPCEVEAISEFNKTSARAHIVRQNFEKLFYPLTVNYSHNNSNTWKWIEGPWPWEYTEGGMC